MNIKKWLRHEFESSSMTTKEFATFNKEFREHITSVLPVDSHLVKWNRGRFIISGFIRKREIGNLSEIHYNDKYIYFSISDVRYFKNAWYNSILIRTAENTEDYTGGSNHYTTLPEFASEIEKLFLFLENGQ